MTSAAEKQAQRLLSEGYNSEDIATFLMKTEFAETRDEANSIIEKARRKAETSFFVEAILGIIIFAWFLRLVLQH
jgi:hypothetical protein